MTKCPYCGHRINTSKELPPLSGREFRIFNTLLNNGREYTDIDDLLSPSGSHTTTRVAIHYLNKKLKNHGMKIVNYRQTGYRLEDA